MRIAQSIDQSKNIVLEEKRKNFQTHRDHVMFANHMRQTMKGSFFNITTEQYKQKIEEAKREAIEYEQKAKELEQREGMMIQRLQNT